MNTKELHEATGLDNGHFTPCLIRPCGYCAGTGLVNKMPLYVSASPQSGLPYFGAGSQEQEPCRGCVRGFQFKHTNTHDFVAWSMEVMLKCIEEDRDVRALFLRMVMSATELTMMSGTDSK